LNQYNSYSVHYFTDESYCIFLLQYYWDFSMKYNQCLFDVILYKGLHIVNFTVARLHLLNLNFVVLYLEVFKDSSCKCSLIFDISIIPFENFLYYVVHVNNFSFKHKIKKYDNKWCNNNNNNNNNNKNSNNNNDDDNNNK
jgi:hypothetical protein